MIREILRRIKIKFNCCMRSSCTINEELEDNSDPTISGNTNNLS